MSLGSVEDIVQAIAGGARMSDHPTNLERQLLTERNRLWDEAQGLKREVERLTAELDEERERHDQARAEVDVLLPPNPTFYMDPPDGGGVDRVEIVRRYIERLEARVAELETALREEQGESLRQAEIARDALTEVERLRAALAAEGTP